MFFKLDESLGVTVTAKIYSNLAGQQVKVNGMSNLTGDKFVFGIKHYSRKLACPSWKYKYLRLTGS